MVMVSVMVSPGSAARSIVAGTILVPAASWAYASKQRAEKRTRGKTKNTALCSIVICTIHTMIAPEKNLL